MKISLTNHTGSRNKGCEALIKSKIDGFTKELCELNLEFKIHSNDPMYDSWRFHDLDIIYSYALKTPNHLSSSVGNRALYRLGSLFEKAVPAKNRFGFSVNHLSTIRSSDMVIASGGDIFTSDYGNLRKHMAPVIAARSSVYLCSHTIGPFAKSDETYFLKNSSNIKLITVREERSYDYLNQLGLDAQVELTADVAFTLPASEDTDLLWSLYFNPNDDVIGLSISEGIIRYSKLSSTEYYTEWAQFIDHIIASGRKVLIIPHVTEVNPNNNDLVAAKNVILRCASSSLSSIRIANLDPSASELKGLIGKCSALVGTRTHATIAAMSQLIPTVSIAYSRKAHGIMQDVFGSAARSLTINAEDLKSHNLIQALETSLAFPPDARKMTEIKNRAAKNFELIRDLL